MLQEEVSVMMRHEAYKHPPTPFHSVHGYVTPNTGVNPGARATATYMVGQSYPAYILSCRIK
jgi:hypothetical protein